MGNITGKGEGEEVPHDASSDTASQSAQNNAVTPYGTNNFYATASPSLSGSASLPKKKLTQADGENSLQDDDPMAVLERVFGDKGVPMVFRWEAGGDEVYITGTFNNWSAKIPMARSGNDFVHIHELARGKHAYKFIVDDEWRFTPDQHTMADKSGNINNFLDLTEFKTKFENLPDLSSSLASKYLDENLYHNRIPDINEYTREPQTLPPHLRSIVLNYRAGVPQHVTLDHLYCTARKDGLMVLGMSQRYQHKYVTTIYYSPVSGGFPNLVPVKKSSGTLSSSGGSGQPPASQPPNPQPPPPSSGGGGSTGTSSSGAKAIPPGQSSSTKRPYGT
jgi:hypothetical protein